MTEFNEYTCCICLQQCADNFESVFANNSARTELSTLGHHYEELFQLSIATEVQQPHYLCSQCSLQLKQFHKFKSKAITSYELFSQFVITAKEGFTICELPDNATEADSKIGVIPCDIEDIGSFLTESSSKEISKVKIEQDVVETEDYTVQEFVSFAADDDSRQAQCENDGVSAKVKKAKQLEEKRDYSCKDCDQIYDSRWRLKRHRKIVHGSKMIPCSMCPKKCVSEENLREHVIVVHQGLSAYECKLCKRMLKTKNGYDFHMRRHRNLRDVICSLCGKGFLTATELRRHLRVHNNERPFPCEICSKRFKNRKSLANHSGIHSDNQHECEYCHNKYRRIDYLRLHIKAVHKGDMHTCTVCGNGFVRSSDLKRHMKLHEKSD